MELELTDREYYADPYYPIIENEAWDLGKYREIVLDEEYEDLLAEEEYLFEDDDWDDEPDLTEAQYQDRSWDEYDDEVFYNSEDLEDD